MEFSFFHPHERIGRSDDPFEKKQVTLSSDDDNVYYKIIAPGFKKEELNITVFNYNVIISGSKKQTSKEGDVFSSEQKSFKYSYGIPSNILKENITSELRNGILVITFPKMSKMKHSSRSIPIIEKS